MDWSKYPNFSYNELRCKQTKKCKMNPQFMETLQKIRNDFGKPMIISSGFRAPEHTIERAKVQPGEHSYGCCVDVLVWGEDAVKLIQLTLNHDITRIGVSQKGVVSGRFIHIGYGDKVKPERFPSTIWTY